MSPRRRGFADLSVKTKILATVGLAALVALIVGILGLLALNDANNGAQQIYQGNMASVTAIGEIETVVAQARVDLANQALSVDAEMTRQFADAFETDVEDFETAMAAYRASGPVGDPAVIDNLNTQWAAWVQLAREELLPAGARQGSADLDEYTGHRVTFAAERDL